MDGYIDCACAWEEPVDAPRKNLNLFMRRHPAYLLVRAELRTSLGLVQKDSREITLIKRLSNHRELIPSESLYFVSGMMEVADTCINSLGDSPDFTSYLEQSLIEVNNVKHEDN